jgi:hypothetical protein
MSVNMSVKTIRQGAPLPPLFAEGEASNPMSINMSVNMSVKTIRQGAPLPPLFAEGEASNPMSINMSVNPMSVNPPFPALPS